MTTAPIRRGAEGRALTSHDVARMAGVSQATVSRVLREDPGVRAETRERVLKVLAEVNYQPNAAARSFRTHRAGAIGVVVARLSYQIYPAMLELIGARLNGLGQQMVVWDAEYGGDRHASRALRQGGVDGVILTACTRESPFIRDVCSPQAPVVLVNRAVDGYPADQVSSDNLDGGRRAAAYFVGCGRRRIAMIGGVQQASPIRDREAGLRQGLQAHGRPLVAHYYQRAEGFTHRAGLAAALRLLELQAPPDAIFCANDVLALGAIDAARTLGLRIPDDLWVIGYDDVEMAAWPAFDLTTFRQPMDEMIGYAVARLMNRIEEPDRPLEFKTFANELVIRRSTGRRAAQADAASAGLSCAEAPEEEIKDE
ncbi:MAG: LacI family DNA-binding transcriptional regulator [Burkholderiaceae bacterium]